MGGRLAAAIGCVALVWCARAAAETEHAEHEHEHRFHLGASGTAVAALTGGEAFHAVGDGLFFTWIA